MVSNRARLALMRCILGCLLLVLLLVSGCKKTHCDRLVSVACAHVEDDDDGVEKCEHLRRQSESVSDEVCAQTLELLKDSGKLTSEVNR